MARKPHQSGAPTLSLGVAGLLGASAAAGALVHRAEAAHWEAGPPTAAPPPSSVTRIASAVLTTDEILLDLLPADRLLALSIFADDPEISNVATRARGVRARVTNDALGLVALSPALVVADAFGNPDTDALLRRVGIPVLRLGPVQSFDDIRDNIRRIGATVGQAGRAQHLVDELDAVLERVRAEITTRAQVRVLLYYSDGFTAGRETLFDEQARRAGAINVAAEAGLRGYADLPLEQALGLDPDALVLASYRADARARCFLSDDDPATDARWAAVRAVREGRVYRLPTRHLLSTSHHAARAVQDLARVLHDPARRAR